MLCEKAIEYTLIVFMNIVKLGILAYFIYVAWQSKILRVGILIAVVLASALLGVAKLVSMFIC